MREISIQKNEAGQRMDKFLAKYLNKAPKSFFYKMMRKKNITRKRRLRTLSIIHSFRRKKRPLQENRQRERRYS